MAIAFDSFGENRSAVSATTSTATINPIGGSNNYLVAFVIDNGVSPSVTGVTWNGTPMTQVTAFTMTVTTYGLYIYVLPNPTITSANLVATRTGTAGQLYVAGAFYTGVDTYESLVTDGTSCSDTSTSLNPTSTADNAWGVMLAYNDNNRDISASVNTFQRGGSYIGWEVFDTNNAITPAQSFTMTVTASIACFGSVGLVLKPYVPHTDYTLSIDTLSLSLVLNSVGISGTFAKWFNLAKSSVATFTNIAKSSTTWTNSSKNSSTWTNLDKK